MQPRAVHCLPEDMQTTLDFVNMHAIKKGWSVEVTNASMASFSVPHSAHVAAHDKQDLVCKLQVQRGHKVLGASCGCGWCRGMARPMHNALLTQAFASAPFDNKSFTMSVRPNIVALCSAVRA